MEIKSLLRFAYRARIRSLTRKLWLLQKDISAAYKSVEDAKARALVTVRESERLRLVFFTQRRNLRNELDRLEKPRHRL